MNTHQALAGQFKKSSLAMSLAIVLGSISTTPMAALSTSTLSFTTEGAVTSCSYGTPATKPGDCNKASYSSSDIVGSYFSMDANKDGIVTPAEKTPIGSLNGIVLGTLQDAGGSHSGGINGSESPNIDNPWEFFGNTGMHQTSGTAPSAIGSGKTRTIDLSGWSVVWNTLDPIPLVPQGPAVMTCSATSCADGNTYVLDGPWHVNGAGFTSVNYTLHLEGTVLSAGAPPITKPDSGKTIVGNTVNIDVLSNDSAAGGLDPASVKIATPASPGLATPQPDGTIDFDPKTAADGDTDMFTYTVNSNAGTPSAPTDVDVTIKANVAPVANPDAGATNTAAFENAGGKLEIDVLKNDTDANNDPGLPGGIDVASVNIIAGPSTGSCTADAATGLVTYSQTLPAVEVSTSCTYKVSDIDSVNPPMVSNTTTIKIDISVLRSDWPTALDPDIIPFLIYEDGVPNSSGNTADKPESGTYFSMLVTPSSNTNIFTTLIKGPDGGLIIGYDQLATGSHTGLPTGQETASVDLGWNFFGNTGMTFTINGGITGNPDGTLKFSGDPSINGGQGKYQITWNGIPEIDLGGSSAFPQDLGFGVIECSDKPCADGSTFSLEYDAHVPPGDPSGFGGVQYGLRMNGEVFFLDGSFQTSDGTFSVEDRLSTREVEPDQDSEIQCAGGCFDYTVTGVTGPTVAVILPLNGGVPASTPKGNPQMRVFRGGAWSNFDTSGNNSILSAPFTKGGTFGTTCPPPDDAAYGPLTVGHQCLQVTIEDNGPNDKDPAVGTITDPSGLGIPTIAQGPDTRKSGTSGCTVASTPVSAASGGAWWLLTGFVAWMGWSRRKSKRH